MVTRKIIFSLFFTLGLVVFGFVFVNFFTDIFHNKNLFTASLAQESVPQTIVELSEQNIILAVSLIDEYAPDITLEIKDLLIQTSEQDRIDDEFEKQDLLNRQIADSQKVPDPPAVEKNVLVQPPPNVVITPNPIIIASTITNGGGGGSSETNAKPIYSKILISEVQIGSADDSKQEFVELYNPNNQEVDLTGWYLQRKTKTGSSYATFVANTLFSGKQITAHGYFLIVREGSDFAFNISVDNPLTEDNSLVLKNPNGEISDKVGFGEVSDYESLATVNPLEGQSIGRKFVDDNEMDTDNNFTDFELDTPTPTAQNVTYIEIPSSPPPVEEPIVILISQVQIEGQTTKDEFVKLYNPGATDIDLAGFSLKKKTSTGNESNLVSSSSFLGTIKAQGYFLIAPQDNDDGSRNYTGLTVSDLRYSVKSASIAPNNTVLLYDNNDVLLDEVLALEPEPSPDPDPKPEPEPEPDPEIEPPPTPILVIINEIAWMGGTNLVGANLSTREWIELFNPGDLAINLTGWKLVAFDNQPSITLSGSIDARGFYLLERSNDDSVPEVIADQIYTGALGNDGENLSLQDALAMPIDQVNSIPWFAGENTSKKTMQRKDPLVSSNEPANWQTSQDIGGTPRF